MRGLIVPREYAIAIFVKNDYWLHCIKRQIHGSMIGPLQAYSKIFRVVRSSLTLDSPQKQVVYDQVVSGNVLLLQHKVERESRLETALVDSHWCSTGGAQKCTLRLVPIDYKDTQVKCTCQDLVEHRIKSKVCDILQRPKRLSRRRINRLTGLLEWLSSVCANIRLRSTSQWCHSTSVESSCSSPWTLSHHRWWRLLYTRMIHAILEVCLAQAIWHCRNLRR